MFKVILALTLCAIASSIPMTADPLDSESWKPMTEGESIPVPIYDTLKVLEKRPGFEGVYTFLNLRNPFWRYKQNTNGIDNDGTYFKFQLDVLYRNPKGKFSVIIHTLSSSI